MPESVKIFRDLSQGAYGLIYSSPYVISETSTLLMVRTQNNENLIENFFSDLYGNTKFISILPWSSQIERENVGNFS